MFLMATSAIGPGFITQTTTFTVQLGAAFAFAIALSVVVDIALQLNVWRTIGISGRRAQELGNLVLPGLGYAMAALPVVEEVHDLHVWQITSGFPTLSAHVLVAAGADCHGARRDLEALLEDRFEIEHTTLQVDHSPSTEPLTIQ